MTADGAHSKLGHHIAVSNPAQGPQKQLQPLQPQQTPPLQQPKEQPRPPLLSSKSRHISSSNNINSKTSQSIPYKKDSQVSDSDSDSDSIEALHDGKEEPPAFTPLKLDKAKLRQIVTSSISSFEQDMIDTQSAVSLFLNSRVKDAESFLCAKYCKTLPHTLGYGVVLSLKSLMTLDRQDIDAAMDALRITVEVSQALRVEQSIVGSLTGFVFGGGRGGKDGCHFLKMTRVQRHAEVVFAEAYLLQAVLSLLTDTNMVAFVREGLNIRQAYSIFRSGFRFLERVWEEEGPEGLVTHQIDQQFINAVYHGVGVFNLVMSVLPAKLTSIFEMIGFDGNREFGTRCLELGANWPENNSQSPISANGGTEKGTKSLGASNTLSKKSTGKNKKANCAIAFRFPNGKPAVTGVRTFLCDLSLHMYHIVLSSMIQMPGCNVPLSRRVLADNLKIYPDSFLYLVLQSRLMQSESRPDLAIIQLNRVIEMQKDWRQLAHICYWDLGMSYAALGKWKEASDCYKTMYEESTWSPAIYLYLQGVCLYMHDAHGCKKEIDDMLKRVPKLCKRVAGKSIPLEKFVSRKSRKYFLQKGRLLFPGYEIVYMWNGFDHVPNERLKQIIQEVESAMQSMETQNTTHQYSQMNSAASSQSGMHSRSSSQVLDKSATTELPYDTYYDDVCLARFFKGILIREQAFPAHLTLVPEHELQQITYTRIGAPALNPPATATPPLPRTPDQEKTAKLLQNAAKHLEHIALIADRVHLDHWILPFARYELAQLYMRTGDYPLARREYQAALNGGYADDEVGHRRRKASMENSLHLRVHNGLLKLQILEEASDCAGANDTGNDDDDNTAD
ncbi:hypothetical protein BASA60_004984 [Batrachochytrium salamandrivorans]|nr:hypothetical protein BASA60_004984 [Batrachochytrium salamandrivorans]